MELAVWRRSDLLGCMCGEELSVFLPDTDLKFAASIGVSCGLARC